MMKILFIFNSAQIGITSEGKSLLFCLITRKPIIAMIPLIVSENSSSWMKLLYIIKFWVVAMDGD
jgi:hypothetical protein